MGVEKKSAMISMELETCAADPVLLHSSAANCGGTMAARSLSLEKYVFH